MDYRQVQQIARQTIQQIRTEVRAGMTLLQVRECCEKIMRELGAESFWYYNVGALVFAGDETTLSVSGRNYQTANRTLEQEDLLTIDLSPQWRDLWGDYARTIVLQDGRALEDLADIRNEEWKNGLLMEEMLHAELIRFAAPGITFDQLYEHMNALITERGFINLDFNGNLGHSIEKHRDARIYIEKGNHKQLDEVKYFTFEPHISQPGSAYGYKKENIYFFENGQLKEL